MRKKAFILLFAITVICLAGDFAYALTYGSMRNGALDSPQKRKANDPAVLNAKKAGWKLPEDLVWPMHWNPNPATPNGVLKFFPQGGMLNSGAVSVTTGHICSYFGRPEPGMPYIATVRVKVNGTVWYGAYFYNEDGFVGGRPRADLQTGRWHTMDRRSDRAAATRQQHRMECTCR